MSAPADSARDVTVIITCYAQQAWVEQCLASVLAQDPPPRAVVVVDDVSPDDTADVIEHWIARHDAPFAFVRHRVNRGLTPTLNEVLATVDTEFLIHISADDWMLPGRVGLQVDAMLAAGPGAGVGASDFIEVDEGGLELARHDVGARLAGLTGEQGRRAFLTRLLSVNVIPAPAAIVRTSAVRDIGGWDESLLFEDYDLWLRLALRHDAVYAPGFATAYRVVGASMSNALEYRPAILESQARILEKLRGVDPEWDELIEQRTVAIRHQLAAGDPALMHLMAGSAVYEG